jgi:DNA/RNA endonuclease YhcR with UshA esterase domain
MMIAMSNSRVLLAKCLVLAFVLLPPACWARTPHITDRQAATHVGQRVVVEGKVVAVYTSQMGTTFLNFGAVYPRQDFSVVIPAAHSLAFPSVQQLQGKRVEVTGVVRLYRGKPEMILRSADQLRRLD